MLDDAAIRGLREAVRLSPDNRPLQQLLAESLLKQGRWEEAEQEYKSALSRWPDDDSLKIGLAQTFYQQGKHSHALVIVEDLLRRRDTPPGAMLLHARLLWQAGDVEFAVRQYKAAVAEDATIADVEFAQRLGIGADETAEVVDGRMRAAWSADEGVDATVERPKTTFRDVGGMESLKEEIQAFSAAGTVRSCAVRATSRCRGARRGAAGDDLPRQAGPGSRFRPPCQEDGGVLGSGWTRLGCLQRILGDAAGHARELANLTSPAWDATVA